LPVEPEVYKIKSGSSESISVASHSLEAIDITSCHHLSISFNSILLFILLSTIDTSTEGQLTKASSG